MEIDKIPQFMLLTMFYLYFFKTLEFSKTVQIRSITHLTDKIQIN